MKKIVILIVVVLSIVGCINVDYADIYECNNSTWKSSNDEIVINVDNSGQSTGEIKNNDEVIEVSYGFRSNTVAKLMFVLIENEDGYYTDIDEITLNKVEQ